MTHHRDNNGERIMALTKIKLDSMVTGTLPDANIPNDITITGLSGTNSGDQTLPTDFVSAASGGTFGGAVTMGSLTSTGIDDNANALAFTIDSDEKVIIGDTASHTTDLLQIESPASGGGHGIQIRRNDSNTDQGVGHVLFGNNTATDLASISAKTDGATDSGALLFNTSVSGGANTERVRIDSSGNVGIGVTAPDQKVIIGATGGVVMNIISDTDANSADNDALIKFSTDGTTESASTQKGTIGYDQGDDIFTMGYGDNPKHLNIGSSGNVGIGDTDPSEAKLSIDNVAADDIGLKIVQAQAVQGVVIEQNGNNQALKIDTAATTNHGLYFDAPATTDGKVIYVSEADDLEGGSIAYFHSDSDDNTARKLVHIINDNDSATGATCLFIDQDSDASGIVIDTEATTDPALYINVPQHTTGDVIRVSNANSLDTGSVLAIEANGDNNDNDNSVVKIAQESASADKTVGILIKQQGDDASIELTGTGGGGIKFSMGTDPDTTGTATGNTLDDYEEGTWTAVPNGGTAITNQVGYYTKIGRMVHVTWYSGAFTGTGSSSTITGLPFTSSSSTKEFWVCYTSHDTWSNSGGGYVNKNNTNIYFQVLDDTDTATSANATSQYIMVSATYSTA
jgi:hypothetical protein